jgi:hypothetical protein
MNYFGDADDRLGEEPKSPGHVPAAVQGDWNVYFQPLEHVFLRGGKGAHAAMHFFF